MINKNTCPLWLGLSIVLGCSNKPPALYPPDWSRAAGTDAVTAYDTDGDGMLSGTELNSTPAMKMALSRLDSNRDGKVSAEEIDGRIQQWRDTQVAIMPATVNVFRNRKPVADIEVALVPEEFLGTATKPAKGTTNRNGTAVMRISDSRDERGVHQGFYRIVLTKKDGDAETMPAKYNAKTEIGAEIAADNPSLQDVMVELSDR